MATSTVPSRKGSSTLPGWAWLGFVAACVWSVFGWAPAQPSTVDVVAVATLAAGGERGVEHSQPPPREVDGVLLFEPSEEAEKEEEEEREDVTERSGQSATRDRCFHRVVARVGAINRAPDAGRYSRFDARGPPVA